MNQPNDGRVVIANNTFRDFVLAADSIIRFRFVEEANVSPFTLENNIFYNNSGTAGGYGLIAVQVPTSPRAISFILRNRFFNNSISGTEGSIINLEVRLLYLFFVHPLLD